MEDVLAGYTAVYHFQPPDGPVPRNYFSLTKSEGMFAAYGGDVSLTKTVLLNPGKIVRHTDPSEPLIHIYLEEQYGPDELFSSFIIQSAAAGSLLPDAFCQEMEDYAEGQARDGGGVGLREMIAAARHLFDRETALSWLHTVLQSLSDAAGSGISVDFTDLLAVLERDGERLEQVLSFLEEDYAVYRQEAAASVRSESTVLLTEGLKPIEADIAVYPGRSRSVLAASWAARDGYSLLAELGEGGHRLTFLKPGLSVNHLFETIVFFENYHSGTIENGMVWTAGENGMEASGSSLSGSMILDLIRENTNPWVTRQTVNYVFPFHYDYREFDRISKRFSRKFEYAEESAKHTKFRSSFLPLFNDYFFNNKELANSQLHSRAFRVRGKQKLSISSTKADFTDELFLADSLYHRELESEIRLFKYGVGFLVCRTSFESRVPLNYILKADQAICSDVGKIIRGIIGSEAGIEYESTRKGIVYEAIELAGDTYVQEMREGLVLKTCSAVKRSFIADPEERQEEIRQKFLQRGDYLFYGFSRSCGVQFAVDKDTMDRRGMDRLIRSFLEEKFFIFLFSAQQRDALRKFSDQLVRNSLKKGKKLNAAILRADFLHFLNHGKLGHISDNNVHTKFYGRWQQIFDNEVIYQEVSQKLDAIDQFQQARVSHKFNLISYVLFPIVFISSFFTMNVVTTKRAIELDLPVVLAFCAVSVLLLMARTKRK